MRILVDTAPARVVRYVGASVYRDYFGLLTMPRSRFLPDACIALGAPWALDNDAFSHFDAVRFEAMLKRYQQYAGCLFVAVPDVVGNARATLNQFAIWHGRIHEGFGFRRALVAQDGLEDMRVPWGNLEALFIGGSTAWKLGADAARLIREAHARGKWVHMGRVNSMRRLNYAHALGCDSVDGSGFSRFIEKVPRAFPALISRQLLMEGF